MNDVDALHEGPEADPDALSIPSERQDALFAGDRGRLAQDTRRVLVQLLLGPSVDSRRQSKLWPVLLRDEAALRERLHDLFLDLIVDREQGVAFTRQVVAPEIDPPILLRRTNLTFFDSVLLIYLRKRLSQSVAQDERAVVSAQEISEHLTTFEKQGNVDQSRFARHIDKTIERATKLSLLHRLRGSADRYEISPTLKLLFPAEEIQELITTYRKLLEQPMAANDDLSSEVSDPEGADAANPDDSETS